MKEIVEKYLSVQEEAINKIRISVPEKSFLETAASDYLSMIRSYFSDSRYFYEKGDYARALASINYAYGWLDSAVRFGLLDGGSDNRLFTLYK